MAVNINGGALEFEAGIDMTKFQSQINQMQLELKSLTKSTSQQGAEMQNYAKKASSAIGSYLSVLAVGAFATEAVKVRGEFQKLEVAFSTMLGSKAKADKLMTEITTFAATTPFELNEVANASKQLLAFGIEAEKIKDTLRSLGDVSAGIGAPLGEIAYLYGTIKTAGKAEGEDIKQFAQRGIPIYEELAKILKVNTENVQEFVSAGKVGFPEIEKVFSNLTAKGSKFGGLMEAQSKTLTGQLANLSDAYTRMLNDMGKSGEGVFSAAIAGATSLVENYQEVLDIIKLLVTMYGSYKAAMIATAVVERIHGQMLVQNVLATKSLTVAQRLGAAATIIWQGAMRSLNAALLTNAPGLAIAGIVALAGALTFLRDTTYETKSATDLLNDAQEDSLATYSRQEAEIKKYVATLLDQNVAESVRLDAYNQLRELAPQIIGDMTYQAAKTADLTDATNSYIASLRQRITLESKQSAYAEALRQRDEKFKKAQKFIGADGKANDGGFLDILNPFSESTIRSSEGELAIKAYREAADVVITLGKDIENSMGGTKEAIQFQISSLIEQNRVLDKTSAAYRDNENQIISLQKSLTNLTKKPTTDPIAVRNEDYLKKEIKRLEVLRAPFAVASKEYADYTKQINALQKELNPQKFQKNQIDLEEKTQDLLRERIELLKEIGDVKKESERTSKTKEEEEIDRVNKKYEAIFQNIDKFNLKVDDFNKKNKSAVSKIGQLEINKITEAKGKEIESVNQKKIAEDYKERLKQQQEIFEKFEQAKIDFGQEKAREMYQGQLQGFDTYLTYLETELNKFKADQSESGKLKTDTLTTEVSKESKIQLEKATEERAKAFKDLLTATVTYKSQEEAINIRYARLFEVLEKNKTRFTDEEYQRRHNILKSGQDEEQKELKQSLIRNSDLLKKMGEDVTFFSLDELRKRIAGLKEVVKSGQFTVDGTITPIPPKVLEQLIALIAQLQAEQKKLAANSKKTLGLTITDFEDIAKVSGEVSGIFQSLSSAFAPLNDELSVAMKQFSEMADVTFNIAKGLAEMETNPLAAAGSFAKAAEGIVAMITAPAESVKKAKKDAEDLYFNLLRGELEMNNILRERTLLQAQSNKLTLEGLKAQKEALDVNKKQAEQEYSKVLALLQNEQFISGLETKKKTGNPALGLVGMLALKTTESKEVLSSLAGKSFEDLEKLFASGQLTENAKKLFEQLKALKQEGIDIDKQLAQLKKEAQEVFTGTTSDDILTAIVDGFKGGLNSAADFAGSFEALMKQAMLNSLKFKYLEGPLKEFYESFASSAESDGQLDSTEIDALRSMYNSILNNASQQFQQLQQISGLNINATGAGANSITGAIKGMTEQQAELLAGQFGGLRITAAESLAYSKLALDSLQKIDFNTATAVQRMNSMLDYWRDVTTGVKKMHIN